MLPLLRPSLVAYNGYDVGLGNRVRVVMGAQSLAELEGRDFFYVWPTGPRFGPEFSDLWSFSGRKVSRATSRLLAKRWGYGDETLDWLDDDARRRRLWQIRTGSEIALPPGAASWQQKFRDLTPSDAIASRVRDIHRRSLQGVPYVGVMIRAHEVSHPRSKQTSPVSWFVERMTALRARHPDLVFFLSCDVPEVQAQVCAEVPGIVAQVDKGEYNTVEGVQSAVCDLYLLAGAGYLLGPHFSSFIHLAEYLAADRLVLETPVSEHRGEVDFVSAGLVDDPLVPSRRTSSEVQQ